MADPRYETVELCLAEAGSDLVPAIEAAQYARLVDHEEPGEPDDAGAIARFLEALAGAAEDWEASDEEARRSLVVRLGALLEDLEKAQLHVHWGVLGRTFTTTGGIARLPVAVITISGTALPSRQVLLPAELDQDPTALH